MNSYIQDMMELLVSEFDRPNLSQCLIADVQKELAEILTSAPSRVRSDIMEDLTIRDLIERAMARKVAQVTTPNPKGKA